MQNKKKILMVCLGNICRSPLAEGVLAEKLGSDYFVDSCGTISLHEGENPDKRAVQTARNHGVDISKQVSRPINSQDFDEFDLILCMDMAVYQDVVSKAKNEKERQKVALFLEEAGESGENIEVPDPYWSGIDHFEQVYQLIDRACEKIAQKITSN